MTDSDRSLMYREIREIPSALDRLLSDGAADVARAADALRATDPRVIVTVARGSSDHAATFFKYAAELRLGIPVASVGPSVASVYRRQMRLDGAACLAISQSGQSPDIVEMARMAGAGGALVLALTNDPASPLAAEAAHPLGLYAGPEKSVAATKTFVTSVTLALWVLAEWAEDAELRVAIEGLPAAMEAAAQADWSALAGALDGQDSVYVLGRGPAYAIALEAALKFKEVCRIHAEAYSSAEVLHGPVSILGAGFPVLALAAVDAAEGALVEVSDRLAAKGGAVHVTSDRAKAGVVLPVVRTGHPLTDPLALAMSFYAFVEALAVSRGIDPDQPRHLSKVTETV